MKTSPLFWFIALIGSFSIYDNYTLQKELAKEIKRGDHWFEEVKATDARCIKAIHELIEEYNNRVVHIIPGKK